MAEYGGDVLVEHDVTFDLFAQMGRRERTLAAWWDWFRWRRFETRAVRRYRRVVVMSEKDAEMLGPAAPAVVIENGVDLERFRAGAGDGPASACSSSAPSATFPTWRPTASSPNRSGRCCATSFRR